MIYTLILIDYLTLGQVDGYICTISRESEIYVLEQAGFNTIIKYQLSLLHNRIV